MTRTEKLVCDNCGSSMEYEADSMVIRCSFCGTEFLLENNIEEETHSGIISRKHFAEAARWLSSIGVNIDQSAVESTTQLDLTGKEVNGPGLKNLAVFPNLSFLIIEESDIDNESVPYLASLVLLKYLYARETGISHLNFVKNMKSITLLDISGTPVTDSDLQHLAGHPSLEKIYLERTDITEEGLGVLSGIPNLKELYIGHTTVGDGSMPVLGSISTLEVLGLDGLSVQAESLRSLMGLEHLREIKTGLGDFKGCDLLRAGVLPLFPDTTSISFLDAGIEDHELEQLKELKKIGLLLLDYNRISDRGLVYLQGHKYLNRLSLKGNSITDAGLPDLYPLKRLKELDLLGTGVTEKGVNALKDKIRGINITWSGGGSGFSL